MSYFNIFLDLIYIQSDAMFINLKKIYFHLIKYLIIDLIINYLFIIQAFYQFFNSDKIF